MDATDQKKHVESNSLAEELDWRVEITESLIEVKARFPRRFISLKKKGSVCRMFTHQARLRMLKMVARINWRGIKQGLFITLTIPDECWPMRANKRNQARYVFFRSMEKHLGKKVGALWRIEWKQRKTGEYKGKLLPHFHLIVPGVPFIAHQLIREWWAKAIGCEGYLATDVQALQGKRHHAIYIAKYAAKVADPSSLDSVLNLNTDGRHWGVHRRNQIPFGKTVVYDGLTPEAVERLKAYARGRFDWYGAYAELGFSLFGPSAEKLVEEFVEICLDYGDARE